MSTPSEFPTEQPSPAPASLAPWGTRALGLLIDYGPVFLLGLATSRTGFVAFVVWAAGIAYWLYMGHLDGVTGQTPGKAMMGIRVVNQQGELIGSGSGIARKVAHIVDSMICLLGWFLPLVDSKRQTIADKIMTTYVVEGLEKAPFAVDLWIPPKAEA